mmetsp:Transcript_62535/g.98758  ORF Transcript_62535/g.98758 Transcript_62535/m.98758 type:complete len:215 (+) Transcript_62535:1716-2360(+)
MGPSAKVPTTSSNSRVLGVPQKKSARSSRILALHDQIACLHVSGNANCTQVLRATRSQTFYRLFGKVCSTEEVQAPRLHHVFPETQTPTSRLRLEILATRNNLVTEEAKLCGYWLEEDLVEIDASDDCSYASEQSLAETTANSSVAKEAFITTACSCKMARLQPTRMQYANSCWVSSRAPKSCLRKSLFQCVVARMQVSAERTYFGRGSDELTR